MDEEHMQLIEDIYRAVKRLGDFIHDNLPEGREKSLAITKLQECQMWADQAVVQSIAEAEPDA